MSIRSLLLLNACSQYDLRMWRRFEAEDLEDDAFEHEGALFWKKLGISDRCVALMERASSSGWIDRELERADRSGVRIVTYKDALYPKNLREMEDAPLLLYMKGEIFSPGEKSAAIVGTRRCSSYGIGVSKELGRRAAREGWCVISGGAKGIDGAAHVGCLDGGGRTIAVFGTGIDVVYPSEHRMLFDKIAEHGLVCTEFPMGAKGEAWHFPRRNRIVVGMASRTVVVESPHKSGAMITARLALDAGREVWSVPGRVGDDRCAGSNRLIFDGALALVDLDLFFGTQESQSMIFGSEPQGHSERPKLSPAEQTIIALLTDNADMTIDNLAAAAKMSAAEVFKIISMLSLQGAVCSSGAGRYRLAE